MKINTLFLAFLFGLSPIASASPWDNLLDSGNGEKITWGVDLGGSQPYQRNQISRFQPASTSKIATAALALEKLGSNYRFLTELRWSTDSGAEAADVEIVGHGDPSWGMSELGDGLLTRVDAMAREMVQAGVRKVIGPVQVRAADPRWETHSYPSGWLDNDKTSCYGALPQAFNININCARFQVRSRTSGQWIERGVATPVEFDIRSGSSTNVYLCNSLEAPIRKYKFCGTWKSGASAQTFVLPIHDTASWVRNLFLISLRSKGVEIVSEPQLGTFLRQEQRQFFSPPVSEIIKPFLKNSIGVLGEAIWLHIGAISGRGGAQLQDLGKAEMDSFLSKFGVSPNEVDLQDGSGLSRKSTVSPSALYQFLSGLLSEPYFPELYDALAVAGVDGTLKNRMKGTKAQGLLRAKTGTLNGVYNLAGYLPDGAAYVPFVMLTSTTTAYSSTARANQDKVGSRLASLVEVSPQAITRSSNIPYLPEHAGLDAQ